jgi:hypothetical protein
MKTIELHIFTNSTNKAVFPLVKIINQTYTSFLKIFGNQCQVTVWCDPNPNTGAADDYTAELKKIFPIVNITRSLVDGYYQAVSNSNADYLFMLEHDWEILPTITHSLNEIVKCMEENNLWYLIFHKFNNSDKFPPNKKLKEQHGANMSFCVTNRVSNNPHIINRVTYLENATSYINLDAVGSNGLEVELTKSPLSAAFYGPISQPAAVRHLNGRTL